MLAKLNSRFSQIDPSIVFTYNKVKEPLKDQKLN